MDSSAEKLVASICNAFSADEALSRYAIAKPLLRLIKARSLVSQQTELLQLVQLFAVYLVLIAF